MVFCVKTNISYNNRQRKSKKTEFKKQGLNEKKKKASFWDALMLETRDNNPNKHKDLQTIYHKRNFANLCRLYK
jgi:hypothetical protein